MSLARVASYTLVDLAPVEQVSPFCTAQGYRLLKLYPCGRGPRGPKPGAGVSSAELGSLLELHPRPLSSPSFLCLPYPARVSILAHKRPPFSPLPE